MSTATSSKGEPADKGIKDAFGLRDGVCVLHNFYTSGHLILAKLSNTTPQGGQENESKQLLQL